MTLTPAVDRNTTRAGTSAPSGSGGPPRNMNLKTEDFIKMMITQLQHQDPMEPAKNEQLLAQMSQIGQLEGSLKLQDSLRTLVLQNNLSNAGSLMGKTVEGMDADGATLAGVVQSVRVRDGGVWLELENGRQVDLARVTTIAPTAAGEPAD